ncbi:hypothetical protein JS528_11210 [Bifidobacterium sp. MA2]|uniref:Uncharacterized protein n=1 Tax=Bifidobacterium santillanense TaxID=2809028 RepID=A0ABS5USD0_9BIFI|nr:hypothetical protein [Bifidobacterium santillanense]MBT1173887.1 hypothetical protein [Bifidobacterium santillanense]
MSNPHIIYDPDPICGKDGDELMPCDFGKYGEGLLCLDCHYWWPGTNYYPDTQEIETRNDTPGQRIPWEILHNMYLADTEAQFQEGYEEGYEDAKANKPNMNRETGRKTSEATEPTNE